MNRQHRQRATITALSMATIALKVNLDPIFPRRYHALADVAAKVGTREKKHIHSASNSRRTVSLSRRGFQAVAEKGFKFNGRPPRHYKPPMTRSGARRSSHFTRTQGQGGMVADFALRAILAAINRAPFSAEIIKGRRGSISFKGVSINPG